MKFEYMVVITKWDHHAHHSWVTYINGQDMTKIKNHDFWGNPRDVERVNVNDFLNEIGQKGWDMCGVDSSLFYFKRQIE